MAVSLFRHQPVGEGQECVRLSDRPLDQDSKNRAVFAAAGGTLASTETWKRPNKDRTETDAADEIKNNSQQD